jgi:hypothetical protein
MGVDMGLGGVGSAPAGRGHLLRLESALAMGATEDQLSQYPRFPAVCGKCMVQDASSAVLQVNGTGC